MTPRNVTIILAIIGLVSLVLASFATVMVLLPRNAASSSSLSPECSLGTSNIARNATSIPGPLAAGPPTSRTFYLQTSEVCAEIDGSASYDYWTFNGTVPGPFMRVRVNDNVTIVLHNAGSMEHSIDLHAVIGPGGGSTLSQTAPGATTRFSFKALHPGLYVYHCATPPADMHIANGMYGMILVEPTGGLPVVDREFYVVQGEFYTTGARGLQGNHDFNYQEMLSGIPDYVVFNGRVGSLQGTGSLTAQVGQKIRVFFGVGGPNLESSFHVIGEIFERVYPEGSVNQTSILTNVQTTLVPAGGATIVEFTPLVPGSYTLVDHSLTWAVEKGAAGTLKVSGTAVPGTYGF